MYEMKLLIFCYLCVRGMTERVAILGGGSWGTTVARHIALNLAKNKTSSPLTMPLSGTGHHPEEVLLWIFEEQIDGRNLTALVNEKRENIKYLPHVELPPNIRATSDISEAVENADVVIFVSPHQFLQGVLNSIRGKIKRGAVAASLIKGLTMTDKGPVLLSKMILETVPEISHVAVLMGANVASDVANDNFVESTVACNNIEVAKKIATLFESPSFHVELCTDVSTVELCGALKNVIALGAGFCDALGKGHSTKAAILRKGLQEIAQFCRIFRGTGENDSENKFELSTLLQSCGIGDLVASCYGGRNSRCASEFCRRVLAVRTHSGDGIRGDAAVALWAEVERDLLNGQKLQGLTTCDEVIACLRNARLLDARFTEKLQSSNDANSTIEFGDLTRSDKMNVLSGRNGDESTLPEISVKDSEDASSPVHRVRFPLMQRVYEIARMGTAPDLLFSWEEDDN